MIARASHQLDAPIGWILIEERKDGDIKTNIVTIGVGVLQYHSKPHDVDAPTEKPKIRRNFI